MVIIVQCQISIEFLNLIRQKGTSGNCVEFGATITLDPFLRNNPVQKVRSILLVLASQESCQSKPCNCKDSMISNKEHGVAERNNFIASHATLRQVFISERFQFFDRFQHSSSTSTSDHHSSSNIYVGLRELILPLKLRGFHWEGLFHFGHWNMMFISMDSWLAKDLKTSIISPGMRRKLKGNKRVSLLPGALWS